jgi:hypothetical protein
MVKWSPACFHDLVRQRPGGAPVADAVEVDDGAGKGLQREGHQDRCRDRLGLPGRELPVVGAHGGQSGILQSYLGVCSSLSPPMTRRSSRDQVVDAGGDLRPAGRHLTRTCVRGSVHPEAVRLWRLVTEMLVLPRIRPLPPCRRAPWRRAPAPPMGLSATATPTTSGGAWPSTVVPAWTSSSGGSGNGRWPGRRHAGARGPVHPSVEQRGPAVRQGRPRLVPARCR